MTTSTAFEFLTSNGQTTQQISVVPLSWIYKKDTKCYWPLNTKGMSFESFVRREIPFKKSWPSYKIKVHLKTAKYEQAEETLNKLIDNSTDKSESSNSSTKPLTQKIIAVSDESDDTSSTDSNTTLKPDLEIEENATCTMASADICDDRCSQNTSVTPTSSINSEMGSTEDKSSSVSTYNSGFESVILKILAEISENVKQHSMMLQEIMRQNKINMTDFITPENVPQFPLTSVEEFTKFDNLLQHETSLKNFLVRKLSALGGSGIESLTRRILKYVLTDELAMKYNWKGRDKLPFEKTEILSVICAAAQLHFPATERSDHRVENVIKDWLKYAKSRSEKRKSKIVDL